MRTVAEWDAHWESRPEVAFDDRAYGLDRVADLRARDIRRIWFPGCGNARAPRVYAELGFDVLATDFSPAAVTEQGRIATLAMNSGTAARLDPHRVPDAPPRPYATRLHDVREPLVGEAPFDLVWDRHVMHAIDEAELPAVARTYAAAARPGGLVVIDLHGVQRHAMYADAIERALDGAGCFVPDLPNACAFRAALAATGVAARTVLGNVFAVDPDQQPAIDAVLRRHQVADTRMPTAEQRTAWVIYSTG